MLILAYCAGVPSVFKIFPLMLGAFKVIASAPVNDLLSPAVYEKLIGAGLASIESLAQISIL